MGSKSKIGTRLLGFRGNIGVLGRKFRAITSYLNYVRYQAFLMLVHSYQSKQPSKQLFQID
jgi:hypothetical protein